VPRRSTRQSSGEVGVKEIERLIKKLELDKEILADQEDDEAAN
jgi:hypothetical protein